MKRLKLSKKVRKTLLITVPVVLVLVAAGATAFLMLREKSPSEIYAEARANAIRTDSSPIYMSFEAEDSSISVKGESNADLNGDNGKMRADMFIDVESDGVPIKLGMELMAFGKDGKTTQYSRIKSVSSRDAYYDGMLRSYYASVINKWQKYASEEDEDDENLFSGNGSIDLLNIMGVFMPVANLSQADKDIYLDTVAKYDLYTLPEKVEQATFKGKDVRKMTIGVSKDVLLEVDNELASKLSDEADYKRTPVRYLDLVFGDSNVMNADVYFDKEKNEFAGMDLKATLKEPVRLETWGSTIQDVSATILIDASRDLKLEEPKGALTEEQYSKLMNS